MRRAIIGCGVTGLVLSAGTLLGGNALINSYERSAERVPGAFPVERQRDDPPAAWQVGEARGEKAAKAADEAERDTATERDTAAKNGTPGFPCQDRSR
ncbi:hypothetical protein [Microtetraspora sp. NBRC 16547]|uniref:hypothetical protein n=1 Tax=Microtetraspora sp. NBRC 16547 TaxID=3030993 RepID=UPI0024A42845|nr:hypothetical protein [Microtetraspora sp. NBRC 16547]GLW96948.1 hypothetical protein Misp02_10350 [Microtetraspora sp. NBRC 16547]